MTPFFLLVLFLSSSCLAASDLASERSALLALRSAVAGRTFLWNINQTTPCNWAGVNCEDGHVTVLRLPGASLAGEIPVGVFGNLTHLRTLSLRLNGLRGPLPADLGMCVNLRNLYLQGNQFSGDVPEFLFGLRDLVRVNLADNKFSGEISPAFDKLNRIRTLYLEGNQLSGSVPELKLPKLEQFNVSNNQLNGSIPVSLRSMPASAFAGNALCGGPLKACPEDNPLAIVGVGRGKDLGKRRKLSGGAIAGIVIGSVVGFLIVLLIMFLLCRKKSRSSTRAVDIASMKHLELGAQDEKMAEEVRNGGGGGAPGGYSVAAAAAAALTSSGKGEVNVGGGGGGDGVKKLVFFGNSTKVFDLEDLLRASAEVLGKGTFGTCYKAVMDTGLMVAVKRLKDVIITEREFRDKIEVVGAMDNEFLVPLRAYYYSRDEKLLVYDYMPMGSLSALLHGNKGAGRTPLSWNIRSSIALGAARGIAYLHSQGPTISHGNVKSSNILLTKSYEARVSDFGLAHLVGPSSTPNRVSGYRAPEVTDPRRVSQKADVYSFGVLLLELLTGKAPTHAILNEEGVDLPRWVQSIVREEWTSEVFDLELLRYQNAEEQMVQLLQLAIDCSAQYPDNRPSMAEVAGRIDELRRSSLQYHNPMYDSVQDADDDDDSYQHRDPPPSTHID
uniref:Protein kinase domain-containing protein n=1 Tax=Kalanchoe fedtschenkoi TaxID=63787 RepID=A0A7N0V384_KALFE